MNKGLDIFFALMIKNLSNCCFLNIFAQATEYGNLLKTTVCRFKSPVCSIGTLRVHQNTKKFNKANSIYSTDHNIYY